MSNIRKDNFIKKAKLKHGDLYDYSLVEFVKCTLPVIIICKVHGNFNQAPSNHLNSSGCSKCSSRYRPTTEEFIERANKKHNNRYDYSLVEYKNKSTYITIICKIHGKFNQIPNAHIRGQNCPKCAGNFMDTLYFIEKSQIIHGNRYDYSLVKFKRITIPVIIICHEHGNFEQVPHTHLSGSGCQKCNKHYMNTEYFIECAKKIHGDKYDYSLVEYVNSKSNVVIICQIHGKFNQIPNNHLIGKKCPKCSKHFMNDEYFIESANKIHNNKYDYSNVKYINSHTNVIIICKKHKNFLQTPNNHLSGRGCPKCYNKTEAKLYEILSQHHNVIFQPRYEWCKNITFLPFDFVIEELKIIIELDGPQHFKHINKNWKSPEQIQKNDLFKAHKANAHGYTLIRLLQEDVLYDKIDWLEELQKNIYLHNEPEMCCIHAEDDTIYENMLSKF